MRPARSERLASAFGLLSASATLVWAATALACLRPRTWPLELCNHLHVVYLAALVPMVVLCAVSRRFRWSLAHALFAAVNLGIVAPAWLGADADVGVGTPLRAVLVNVNAVNRDHEGVLALLRREQPDVAVVLEVTEPWEAALASLKDWFPHQHVVTRADCFGIALLGRRPFGAVQRCDFGDDGLPSLVAHWLQDGVRVQLVATHPLPPMRRATQQRRDRHLHSLRAWLGAQAGPVVVLGDLNTAPWAPAFTDLLVGTRLRDGRGGHGILPTWPAHRGVAVVPIDHVLVSPEVAVSDLRVGPAVGSDHLPLVADLRVRGGPAARHAGK